jgi:sugar phosphate isomerase/epimerase
MNTDSLDSLSFAEMLDFTAAQGIESLEIATGNWSKSPHIDLDTMLQSKEKRDSYLAAIKDHGMTLEALNCSGNQLAPNELGKLHQENVLKTLRLAGELGVETIVMMSGLPGGAPGDTTANWVTTSWPPETADILRYQWEDVLIPYWRKTAETAKGYGIKRIALENHPAQLMYNPETMIRLRDAVGSMVGMNLDPSHMMWMGGDPIAMAQELGAERIYHVHAKDVRLETSYIRPNGALDTKTIDKFATRAWNFVALGYGRDARWWKEFFSVLSMLGYDGPVSLEMEDLTMDPIVGVKKSLALLKEVLPREFS